LGQRVGGWVIHFPAVVCTSSPIMTVSLGPCYAALVLVNEPAGHIDELDVGVR
jgi:hypothetical protein